MARKLDLDANGPDGGHHPHGQKNASSNGAGGKNEADEISYALTTQEEEHEQSALDAEASHNHSGPGDPLQAAVESLKKNKNDQYTTSDQYIKSAVF